MALRPGGEVKVKGMELAVFEGLEAVHDQRLSHQRFESEELPVQHSCTIELPEVRVA